MNKFHFDKNEQIFNAKLLTNYNNIFNTGFPPSPGVKQDCFSRHLFFMTQSENRLEKPKQNKPAIVAVFSWGFFAWKSTEFDT